MLNRKQNKQKNKKFDLISEYKKAWNYIKDSKKFIWIIVFIFILFSLIGFFISPPEQLYQKILDFIQQLLLKTEGMSQFQLIKFIFLNNLQTSFIGMFFGFFFGIFPVLASIANGYMIGFVGNIAVSTSGILSLWRILPHGIFELPAIFLSFGLGIRLGFSLFNPKKYKSLKENVIFCLKILFLIIIPLLIIAAIIEGTLIFLKL